MTLRTSLLSITLVASSFCLYAQQNWIKLRSSKTVETHAVEKINDITFTGNGAMETMTVNFPDGTSATYKTDEVSGVDLGYTVPEIRIVTDDPSVYDVVDKINYLPAKITVKPNGYPGMAELNDIAFNIRGRGNSTMSFPKKPYRLKFAKKTELSSEMKKAKNYALIANYIDNSLMRNTTAFMIASLLEMPYTNHSIPCNVYFNNRYVGSYMLTEKVGLNAGHIDDIDETQGIFLEMDSYFDEPYKFRSECYNLPMMIKDPDFDELKDNGDITSQTEYLQSWKEDWNKAERILAGKDQGNIWDYIDLNSLVDYLLVYNVCNNAEISHPKSNYIHKRSRQPGEKYKFGSVWDFDWAFTYYDNGEGSGLYNNNMFDGGRRKSTGSVFYRALIQTPGFNEAYRQRWDYFKSTLYPQLIKQMDEYADVLEPSALENWKTWTINLVNPDPTKNNFRNGYDALKTWLAKRVDYLDSAPNFGFFNQGDNPETPDFSGLVNQNDRALSISFSEIHPGDGTGLTAISDNNTQTWYHSYYFDNKQHHPVYGSYVDWLLTEAISKIGFRIGTRNTNTSGAPKTVDIYGSNNGIDWVKLHTFTGMTSRLDSPAKECDFGIIETKTPYRHIRFSVIESNKGSLTITEGSRENGANTYWNVSTLKLFGN